MSLIRNVCRCDNGFLGMTFTVCTWLRNVCRCDNGFLGMTFTVCTWLSETDILLNMNVYTTIKECRIKEIRLKVYSVKCYIMKSNKNHEQRWYPM